MAVDPIMYDAEIRHQVFLERLKTGEVAKFAPFLKEMDLVIRDRLSRGELTEFSRDRLERLLETVDGMLLDILDRYKDELKADLVDIAQYEATFEASALRQVSGSLFEAVVPAISQIRSAVLTNPLSVRGADGGKLLEPFIQGWASTERARVVNAIRQGFFEGQTNSEIIKAIRGTKALQYKDGILATTDRNASAIVRTAVQHVATQARMETLRENSDVVVGVKWVSTLDSRTTQQCRSLDSTVFPLDSGPRPPLHINCRSSVVALTRLSELFSKDATRAAKGAEGRGQVDASLSYYDWLQSQPASFQDEALGKARAKLFRDGGLTAQRFSELQLDRNFKALTLDQMRALEPLAFQRAGLNQL
jgi:SPP1 gp7 family putative phage head morphogenesis protein